MVEGVNVPFPDKKKETLILKAPWQTSYKYNAQVGGVVLQYIHSPRYTSG